MRIVTSALSFALLVSAVACNDGGPPPASPVGSSNAAAPPPPSDAPVTTVVIDAGAPSSVPTTVAAADPPASPVDPSAGATASAGGSDGGADFTSCTSDSDCIAVPQGGCCPNGRREGINKQSVAAYKASVACEKKHRICPQYRVMDYREAVCGSQSHKCELMQPDQIACAAGAPNAHTCPGGWACDSGGHCAGHP